MRIIKPITVEQYWTKHRDARKPLEDWLILTKAAAWASIEDVRKSCPAADAAKGKSGSDLTIFNIKGNSYRLVVSIHYATGIVFIRDFLTHAEYSKDQWKDSH